AQLRLHSRRCRLGRLPQALENPGKTEVAFFSEPEGASRVPRGQGGGHAIDEETPTARGDGGPVRKWTPVWNADHGQPRRRRAEPQPAPARSQSRATASPGETGTDQAEAPPLRRPQGAARTRLRRLLGMSETALAALRQLLLFGMILTPL